HPCQPAVAAVQPAVQSPPSRNEVLGQRGIVIALCHGNQVCQFLRWQQAFLVLIWVVEEIPQLDILLLTRLEIDVQRLHRQVPCQLSRRRRMSSTVAPSRSKRWP